MAADIPVLPKLLARPHTPAMCRLIPVLPNLYPRAYLSAIPKLYACVRNAQQFRGMLPDS